MLFSIEEAEDQNSPFSSNDFKLATKELSRLNLSGVDLSGADLRRALLKDANLTGANLTSAILTKADLSGADLSGADLSGADLRGADLIRADLSGADLSETLLNWVDLRGANLSGATLVRVYLRGANLSGADLSGANLRRALLREANLTGANLTSAILTKANLSSANLWGANMQKAHVSLNLGNWQNVDLTDARVEFFTKDKAWGNELVDVYLNHITNPQTGSLLTAIRSIDARFEPLKLYLMCDLLRSLENVDISSATGAMIEVLIEEPFISCREVHDFLQEKIFKPDAEKLNISALTQPSEEYLTFFLIFISRLNDSQKQDFMIKNNSAFIQLIAHAEASDNDTLRRRAIGLYEAYLTQEPICTYLKQRSFASDFGDYSGGQPDWDDASALNYILLSEELVMVLSRSTLLDRLSGKSNDWGESHFIYRKAKRGEDPLETYPPEKRERLLETGYTKHFIIFSHPYAYQQRQVLFQKLITSLPLGPYEKIFKEAVKTKTSTIKLVSTEHQLALNEIFKTKLSGEESPSLKEEHYEEILAIYGLGNTGDGKKAETFFCLAATFAKYSSSYIFGTEGESPESVRYYACALMNKAYELSPAVFPGQNDFRDWQDKLLGKHGSFTCTAVLSGAMLRHANEKCGGVLSSIIPPAWT